MNISHRQTFGIAALLLTVGLAGCEQPPMDVVQRGYRGTGMEQVINRDDFRDKVDVNEAPAVVPPVPAGGPKASEIYQNVQVLGDLSAAEFNRLMVAITNWVSPEQGCTYCHGADGFASDDVYTKKVARVMIAMTQRANEEWGDKHTAPSGVTCYTCHRGKNVPEYVWTQDPGPKMPGAYAKYPTYQNIATETAAYSSLPFNALSRFLADEADQQIRVAGTEALPYGNDANIKDTEWTYALMMHFSQSLGVNCTYCHNSRAFAKWEQSPPTRLKAWHAIRMVREMNSAYIGDTVDYLPDNRKGPLGDPLKLACNTCHQGAYKPLYGAPVIKDYPYLSRESRGSRRLITAAAGDEASSAGGAMSGGGDE